MALRKASTRIDRLGEVWRSKLDVRLCSVVDNEQGDNDNQLVPSWLTCGATAASPHDAHMLLQLSTVTAITTSTGIIFSVAQPCVSLWCGLALCVPLN